jgi:hypothetical protein
MKFKVFEGLQRKSLDYLVQPVVSIDEFESKISDKRAIVVGFYCGDKDPATDLSNFIDKSSQPILDTEVSPAPTLEGYYVVWVELSRNKEFPQILLDLLSEVDNLTNVDKWEFQSPGQKDPIDLTKENLIKILILDPNEIIELSDDESTDNSEEEPTDNSEEDASNDDVPQLEEFWLSAVVDKILLENSTVTLYRFDEERSYKIIEKLPSEIDFLFENTEGKILQTWLGPAYNVYPAKNGFIVESGDKAFFAVPID